MRAVRRAVAGLVAASCTAVVCAQESGESPSDGVLTSAVAERLALPLQVPVEGLKPDDLPDTFDDARGQERRHEALDIMAARGTPVRAVDDGEVVKLFLSEPGGLTVYQFDRSRSVAYYYAHLDRYADGLAEGQRLRRGDPIGAVGSTGNADPMAPHLHFAVFELGPEQQWWRGRAIDPLPLFRCDARRGHGHC